MVDRPLDPTDYPARSHYRSKAASGYDQRRTATRSRRRKWVAEMAALDAVLREFRAGATLLDVPCGTGRFLPLVRDHGLPWIGGDISLDMLHLVRSSGGPETSPPPLFCCDAECLPFPDRAFDYVMSFRFLNLLPEKALQNVLRELGRVARRGVIAEIRLAGTAPLVDPGLRLLRASVLPAIVGATRRSRPRRSVEGAAPSRVFPFPSKGRFLDLVEQAGLRLADVRQVGGWRGRTHADRLKVCLLRPQRESHSGP